MRVLLGAVLLLLFVARPTAATGTLDCFVPSAPARVGDSPLTIVTADFDEDGKPDAATANANTNDVSILLGDGFGGFNLNRRIVAGSSPQGLAKGDLNRDGHIDLVVTNSVSNNVTILLGTGTGDFERYGSLPVAARPFDIAVGDLNGDSIADLVIGHVDPTNHIWTFVGRGNGEFDFAGSVDAGNNPLRLVLADFNRDGRLDVAISNFRNGTVGYLRGLGDGTLAARVDFNSSAFPMGISAADVNGDRNPDVLVTNGIGGNTVAVLIGTGTGSFEAPRLYPAVGNPQSVAVGDLTGDGILDLAVGSRSFGTLALLEGTSDGTFTLDTVLTIGNWLSSVVIADFNLDNRLDVATTGAGSSEPRAWVALNNCEPPLLARDDEYTLSVSRLVVSAPGVLANDAVPPGVTPSVEFVVRPPGSMENLGGSGGFIYAPDFGFSGTITFGYVIHAGGLTSNVAEVRIHLIPDPPPVAVDDKYTIRQGERLEVLAPGILQNDVLPQNVPASVEFVTFPPAALDNLGGSGGFTLTPHSSFSGEVSFRYVFHTPLGTSNAATITVHVLPRPNLSVIDVTAIQAMPNAPLIAGKSTAVGVVIRVNNPGAITAPTIDLEIAAGDRLERQTIDSASLRDGLTVERMIRFNPATRLTLEAGVQTVRAVIDPENAVNEVDESDNERTKQFDFQATRGLHIGYVPINSCQGLGGFCYDPPTQFGQTITATEETLRAIFPVANNDVAAALGSGISGSPVPCLGVYRDLVAAWYAGRAANPGVTKVLAVVSPSYFDWHNTSIAPCDFSDTVGFGPWVDSEVSLVTHGDGWTAAHELGHMMGIAEEEYETHPPNGRAASGLWVEQNRVVASTCFMGKSNGTFPPNWIDRDHFDHLLERLSSGPEDPELLLVSTLVSRTGGVEVLPWMYVPEGVPSRSNDGNAAVRVLDASGQLIASVRRTLTFQMRVEPFGLRESDVVPLLAAVPYPADAATIEIESDNMPLVRIDPRPKLLRDVIEAIPDQGFDRNPTERRKALLNKVDAVEKMILHGAPGVTRALAHDVRASVERWVLEHYETGSPLESTRQHVLSTIDAVIARLP